MSDQTPASPGPQAGSPQESFGSAPAGAETIGSTPAGAESIGSAPEPVVAPPKTKSSWPAVTLAVVVLGILTAVLVWRGSDDAVNAEVGDCLNASAVSTVLSNAAGTEIVDCADAAATHKIIGIVPNKKTDDFDFGRDCAPWKGTATSGIWLGDRGATGQVFCVQGVRK